MKKKQSVIKMIVYAVLLAAVIGAAFGFKVVDANELKKNVFL